VWAIADAWHELFPASKMRQYSCAYISGDKKPFEWLAKTYPKSAFVKYVIKFGSAPNPIANVVSDNLSIGE
jgi:hypothetical protein